MTAGTVIQRTERPRPARAWLRAWAAGLLALPAALLTACTDPMTVLQKDLDALHAQGRYDEAAAVLDDPESQRVFGEKNRLLYWLNRGAVALARDNPETAIEMLEHAESTMEVAREPTAGEELGKWLINDTAAPYYGEPYEEMYVNVLKLLAQLERGNIEGGATVEARRLAGKADVLRDRHLRTVAAIEREGSKEVRGFSPPRVGPFETSGGAFVESPLGTYLTAVTFMKSGETDLQSVAGRRLLSSIEAQGRLIGPVDPRNFAALGELPAEEANALFVALSGRGPTKEAESFGPIPLYTYTIYYELPVLRGGSGEVDSALVVFEDGSRPPIELSLVEDMRSVARANHEAHLPVIYLRAFLRSSLKAAAVAIGTEAARRGASRSDSGQAVIEIAGILGGLLLVSQTEKADLRSWTFLPGRAHVGLAKLTPGEHRVRIDFYSGGRRVHSSPVRTISVGGGARDLATVVEHYWR